MYKDHSVMIGREFYEQLDVGCADRKLFGATQMICSFSRHMDTDETSSISSDITPARSRIAVNRTEQTSWRG